VLPPAPRVNAAHRNHAARYGSGKTLVKHMRPPVSCPVEASGVPICRSHTYARYHLGLSADQPDAS
jgi:hypothetical protein